MSLLTLCFAFEISVSCLWKDIGIRMSHDLIHFTPSSGVFTQAFPLCMQPLPFIIISKAWLIEGPLETQTQLTVIYFIKNKHQPLIVAQILRKPFSCLSGQTYSSWGVIHHNDTVIVIWESTYSVMGSWRHWRQCIILKLCY